MLELYFVYNGHCKFYLGTFDNVDDLIEQMEDHQWAFSAITHPRFQKHIGQRTTRFDYGSKDCYYLATQEIHLFVEFLKEQYGQGRPDYIEALNDLDGLVEVSYREAIERFLEDEVR